MKITKQLMASCWTKENVTFVKKTLAQLEDDPHIPKILARVDNKDWNIWCLLAMLAKKYMPKRYLEIGVRRGFSMAMIVARGQTKHITGFDLWIAGYGGAPNPGPDFVRAEMGKFKSNPTIELISGDTKATLPAYTPDAPFELILVDGDHSLQGATQNLENCLGILDKKGSIVVDDLDDSHVLKACQIVADKHNLELLQFGNVGIIS